MEKSKIMQNSMNRKDSSFYKANNCPKDKLKGKLYRYKEEYVLARHVLEGFLEHRKDFQICYKYLWIQRTLQCREHKWKLSMDFCCDQPPNWRFSNSHHQGDPSQVGNIGQCRHCPCLFAALNFSLVLASISLTRFISRLWYCGSYHLLEIFGDRSSYQGMCFGVV